MNSPFAAHSPSYQLRLMPTFLSRRRSRMRLSRAAYSCRMARVPSVPASSLTSTSKGKSVRWASTLSSA